MKGVYLLLLELADPAEIQVRSGRRFSLEEGFYGYIGSAMNGLESRVGRHLGGRKKRHWHIDFLLERAVVLRVITATTTCREECTVAHALTKVFRLVPRFGASDCSCLSHLFFSLDLPSLEREGLRAFRRRRLIPTVLTPDG